MYFIIKNTVHFLYSIHFKKYIKIVNSYFSVYYKFKAILNNISQYYYLYIYHVTGLSYVWYG